MQKIQCPVCHQDGVLQWKKTITKVNGKSYCYRKLYVYHQHPKEHPNKPKWCYLRAEHLKALGLTQKTKSITQNLTQNIPLTEKFNLTINRENKGENQSLGSLARLGHHLGKVGVAGSKPARGSILQV